MKKWLVLFVMFSLLVPAAAVQAHVEARVISQHPHRLGKPRAGDHQLHAAQDSLAIAADAGLVRRMRHTHVIAANSDGVV